MPTIAERVARWRRYRRLKSGELAEKLGLWPSAVSAWESGAAEPTQANLRKLCGELGLTEAEFYGELPELDQEVGG